MKEKILSILRQADSVYIGDSPLLGSFPTEIEDGELTFNWVDDEGEYIITIPEASLDSAKVTKKGFVVMNDTGDEVILAPYKLTPIGF